MSVHSLQRKKRRDHHRLKYKSVSSHEEFLARITKSLNYGRLPTTDRFSLPVSELAAELFSEVKGRKNIYRLRLEEVAYMSRNACISPCSLVLAMLYLERLKIINPDYLAQVSARDLFVVSTMVASKFLNDDGEDDEVLNCEWVESSYFSSIKELNAIEMSFLQAIDWKVYVHESEFWTRLKKLEFDVALKEGKRRGWFSYHELMNLLDSVEVYSVAQAFVLVSAVCLASYTAGLLCMFGSTVLVTHLRETCLNATSSPGVAPVVVDPATHVQCLSFNNQTNVDCELPSSINLISPSDTSNKINDTHLDIRFTHQAESDEDLVSQLTAFSLFSSMSQIIRESVNKPYLPSFLPTLIS